VEEVVEEVGEELAVDVSGLVAEPPPAGLAHASAPPPPTVTATEDATPPTSSKATISACFHRRITSVFPGCLRVPRWCWCFQKKSAMREEVRKPHP
jgi:hypothetical protein